MSCEPVEKTLESGDSPYDRYARGETDAREIVDRTFSNILVETV